MKKKIAGILLAIGITTGAMVAGPVITADLGVGGVQTAEAYSAYSCHSHYSGGTYGTWSQYCYVDWNWYEETFQWRVDGWHQRVGSGWVRTVSHYHSGWA